MKNYYLIITLTFSTIFSFAQNYELGIVHISNYDFKIVAIPDFASTGNTDASDIGFTLVLPTGSVDAINPVGLLTSRTWSIQEFDATFLTNLGLGDGTKDVFQFNLPPGQSVFSHTSGQQIDLVSFTITNTPITGEMTFLLNSDSIALGAGGVLDSFYNSNIDSTTTQDYFSTPAVGLDSFMFSLLDIEDNELLDLNLKIHPNPANNVINIQSQLQINNIELYNILGKRVVVAKSTNQIKVNTLKSGVYLIKIKTEKGQVTKKIVIK